MCIRDSQIRDTIAKSWTKGFIYIDEVNDATIHYVCKYIFKQKNHTVKDLERPFRLMSKRPPIGCNYIEKLKEYHYNGKYFVNKEGFKVHLPRFYANKIFDDEMKEVRKEHFQDLAMKKSIEDYSKPALELIEEKDLERQYRELKTRQFNEQLKKSKL